MREGDAFELLADDPVALVDVPALAQANGWSLTIDDCENFSRFCLQKAASGVPR
jgi:tRNA 2-thiouridine synthesizing protein A